MRTDNDIYLSFLQIAQHILRLLGCAGTRQVVDTYWHILQAALERTVVLVGQYRRRHHHRHLLGVAAGFEGGADGHFGLAEAHVAADQAVHRERLLHIGLHVLRSLQLVGRVLVKERCLKLVLQVAVVAIGKTTLAATLGVKFDQVARNVLDMFLRALLQALPLTSAKGTQARGLAAVLRLVFRHLIQGVNRDVDSIATLVDDLNHLLILLAVGCWLLAVSYWHTHQTAELADAVIHMHYIVAYLELLDFLQRQRHLATTRLVALEVVLMETVKDLMVGQEAGTGVSINKALVQRMVDGHKRQPLLIQDILQTFLLLLTVS